MSADLRVPCCLILLGLPAGAAAQGTSNLEDRQVEIEDAEVGKAEVSFSFESEWHEFNNLDFRELDESSDQAILDSDDRGSFAFTGVWLELGYRIDPKLQFVVGASHRGLWGNDQLGNTNAFGGWVYFNALYMDYDVDLFGDNNPRIRVGRQYFDLGGLAGSRDYILSDVLDMVRVDVPIGDVANLIFVPINLMSTSGSNDGADFVSFIGQSELQTFNFRGDRPTRRHAFVAEFDGIPGPIDLRAYAAYTDIGSLGSGSDITYDGLLGNFSDGDWVANSGIRAQAEFGPIRPFLHADGSRGIDRKELVVQDVDCNGFAYGAGVRVHTGDDESGFRGELTYFDALGPAYSTSGPMFSHGYVGMKGRQLGGTLMNQYLGWHPSAYTGLFGVEDTPHEMSRKAGTRVIHARAGYDIGKPLSVSAAWWMAQDTGLAQLSFNNLDNLTIPFGYAREEFEAQQRLGELLGHEFNLDIGARAGDHVDVYVNGAMVLAGDFYGIEVARVAGTALGSPDPVNPWSLSGGTRVSF